ncbi:MAG: hypothetical protein H0W02_00400 [Ktedonobacteraceae bacterium]|nr:hypothetical protein [Ktedonobacteraceae bacterium]
MPENMRAIGRIISIQVQPTSLKYKHDGVGYYDPTPLLVVESLRLSNKGIIGVTADAGGVMDVHHVEHPQSGNSRRANGVSIGFTSHYQAMRARFGERLLNGCAGENILVETDSIMTLADLGSAVAIQVAGSGQLAYLTRLKVAAPCVEFSHFAANAGTPLPAAKLKDTLQFLHNGLRGFYATLTSEQGEISVRAGDRVFVVEDV